MVVLDEKLSYHQKLLQFICMAIHPISLWTENFNLLVVQEEKSEDHEVL